MQAQEESPVWTVNFEGGARIVRFNLSKIIQPQICNRSRFSADLPQPVLQL